MKQTAKNNSFKFSILEKGDIFFFYRAKTQDLNQKIIKPKSIENIQRFYIVLHPYRKKLFRLMIIGKKKLLSSIDDHDQKNWITTEMVSSRAADILRALKESKYKTKTTGYRLNPTSYPAGEGVYSIATHHDHVHFVYKLELPKKINEVQRTLNIQLKANYIITVKNQEKTGKWSKGVAKFPKKLKNKFAEKRFTSLVTPDFLDYENAEFLLVSTGKNLEKKLDKSLPINKETLETADIFQALKFWQETHLIKPLLKGKWG